MEKREKIYFVSDVHLGFPNPAQSLVREKKLVRWLEMAARDAKEIYLLGDIFEFWYEWKRVAPRGFTRFLGKLGELTDKGLPIHFFTGNHDIWVFDYLQNETGVILHREPFQFAAGGKKFFVAHGDGLGPFDKGFKRMKKMFTNRFFQWMFSRLHPNFAVGTAYFFSERSRKSTRYKKFVSEEKEWLNLFARSVLEEEHFDYFIFGHRHLVLDIKLPQNSRYINLGEWIRTFSYAVFDGNELNLKYFEKQ